MTKVDESAHWYACVRAGLLDEESENIEFVIQWAKEADPDLMIWIMNAVTNTGDRMQNAHDQILKAFYSREDCISHFESGGSTGGTSPFTDNPDFLV